MPLTVKVNAFLIAFNYVLCFVKCKLKVMKAKKDYVMPFGKYKGRKLGDILYDNPNYIIWLCTNDILKCGVSKVLYNKALDWSYDDTYRMQRGYINSQPSSYNEAVEDCYPYDQF